MKLEGNGLTQDWLDGITASINTYADAKNFDGVKCRIPALELRELVRGYRDFRAMLREWVKYAPPCICSKLGVEHAEDCHVGRTEALLAEDAE